MRKPTRFLLQWIWLLPLLIWFALTVTAPTEAELSDETKKIVDELWWKHYGSSIADNVISYDPLSHWSWLMTFDDGVLTIKTSDGTWFIEMTKVEEVTP